MNLQELRSAIAEGNKFLEQQIFELNACADIANAALAKKDAEIAELKGNLSRTARDVEKLLYERGELEQELAKLKAKKVDRERILEVITRNPQFVVHGGTMSRLRAQQLADAIVAELEKREGR